MLRFSHASLDGVLLLRPRPHVDARGFFVRTYAADDYAELGLHQERFVQENQSRSVRGVVRGLHGNRRLQEAKLIRCSHGRIFDVAVDIRPWSPTFGRWEAFVIDDASGVQLYLPPGFLHGFCVLSDAADVCYKVDAPYDPNLDLAVRWDDPDLAIPWPVEDPIVSERDRLAGGLHEALAVAAAWRPPAEALRT